MDKTTLSWWLLLYKNAKGGNASSKLKLRPFVDFFIYFSCIDGILAEAVNSEDTKTKTTSLDSQSNKLTEAFDNVKTTVHVQIKGLCNFSCLEDRSFGTRKRSPALLSENPTFSELMSFMYRIRGNLFHGKNDVMESVDIQLVQNASEILEKILEEYRSTI